MSGHNINRKADARKAFLLSKEECEILNDALMLLKYHEIPVPGAPSNLSVEDNERIDMMAQEFRTRWGL